MILGRVAGRVVQTIQHPATMNRRLLIVDRLDPDGAPSGGYLVAVDSVGAGHGETVLVLDEGNGARQILQWENAPVRSVVVGIIDASG
ncbi:EutN/CcmL family microcompartment protein [bacterium]|nr:EutN/CcmL family microcompartment protein [bacterium]MBU1677003.1 EutN/CcmL family microcompartment protein [bacterium]